jgi:hypothetical protein
VARRGEAWQCQFWRANVKKWEWRGGRGYGVKAEVAGAEIERLSLKYSGELSARQLLEESKGPQAPLHKCFEWDDSKAAKQYRIEQAGVLLSSIRVIVEDEKKNETPHIAFVSVQTERGRKYVSVGKAMSKETYKMQVLGEALQQLKAATKRYEDLSELGGIRREVDKAERRYLEKKKKAS